MAHQLISGSYLIVSAQCQNPNLSDPRDAYYPWQATLAAANVAGILQGFAVWPKPDNVLPFIEKPLPSLPQVRSRVPSLR